MTGTELQIIHPENSEIAGGDAERLPTVHTTAKRDDELITVWLKSHTDGSPHTLRAYERIGRRFVAAIEAAGSNLRRATIDDCLVVHSKCFPVGEIAVAQPCLDGGFSAWPDRWPPPLIAHRNIMIQCGAAGRSSVSRRSKLSQSSQQWRLVSGRFPECRGPDMLAGRRRNDP